MSSEHCAICRSTAAPERLGAGTPAADDRHEDIAVCPDCGHGTRVGERTFDENIAIQEDFYQKTPTPPRRRRWPERPALLAARVRRMLGDSGAMLDIGCGPGTWLAQFGPSWRKYGVDVSRKAADMARQTTGAEVFCGPIEAYEDAPRSLDLITAFALIEHLQDPRVLVEWSSDHLRDGGLLVLMTGDRESGVARALGSRWPMYQPSEHVHFFSARSLALLLEDSDLEVVRKEWRPMIYARPTSAGSVKRLRARGERLVRRMLAKTKEIAGLVDDGHYDHLYVYARRRHRKTP